MSLQGTIKGLSKVKNPGLMRRILIGGGEALEETAGNKQLATGRLGTFDEDLFGARRFQRQLKDIGVEDANIGISDVNKLDADRFYQVEDAMPGFFQRFKLDNPEAVAQGRQRLKNVGIDLSDEQYADLVRRRTGARAMGTTLKNFIIGEAPLKVMKERAMRGGLVGKGGLLTADLAPDIATRRRYKKLYESLQKGDYGQAAGHAMGAGMGSLGYAANLGFNYGLPVVTAYEAANLALDQGKDPVKATGAALTSAATNIAMAPVGAIQMFTADPINRGIQSLWGVGEEAAKRPGSMNQAVRRSAGLPARSPHLNPQMHRAQALQQQAPPVYSVNPQRTQQRPAPRLQPSQRVLGNYE